MKIDILNPTAPMAQSGSSLRTMIQNSKDPLLDLFTRETIQNCADAGDNSSVNFVKVDFITGMFNKGALNCVLDGITATLNERFPNKEYPYLAVRDSNTTGLKGPLKTSEITNGVFGNLENLVYQICKPQDTPGSGGSWGMGKTIYFRMNPIGLVLYYSRTKNNSGQYESRLCAAMVEDEKKADAILPAVNGNKSGVAWWGMEQGKYDTHSYPITDEVEIKSILDIFGIEPYGAVETGTIILLPYIDANKLLNHNKVDCIDENGESIVNSWDLDLVKYLKLAIQRWYAPRLDNPFYFRRTPNSQEKIFKFLKIFVNGEEIKSNDMEPIFQLIQDLYNEASSKCFNCGIPPTPRFPGIASKPLLYNRIRGSLGQLAYVKLDKSVLTNGTDLEPLSYVGIPFDYAHQPHEKNLPIIGMTRRPGMIVEYNSLNWMTSDLPTTSTNEFIIALFVLNSYAVFNEDRHYNLEEYIRSKGGERADHIGWYDHALVDGGKSSYCVSQMTRKTSEILKEAFLPKEESSNTPKFGGLSALLGHILELSPSRKGTGGTRERKQPKLDGDAVRFFIKESKYKLNEVEITIDARTKKTAKETKCIVMIDADSAPISAESWEEENGFKFPFNIKAHNIVVESYDSKANSAPYDTLFKITPLTTSDSSIVYGLRFETLDQTKHAFQLTIKITLELGRRDLRPSIDFK